MAGFEVVVRPVVFPNIRPTPKRSLAPEADPEKGICEIRGSSGRVIDLPFSWSVSTSGSRPQERQRREDDVRVYQKDDDGTVNRDNFVDVKVATKVWMVDPAVGQIVDNVFIPNQGGRKIETPSTYAGPKEADNIEIRSKDNIRKNPSYKEGS